MRILPEGTFTMASLLKDWNGDTVVIKYDHPTGAWIFIALYSTKLNKTGGGTRMKPYVS
jgi:hypothetical protein